MRRVNQAGFDLIKKFEGLKLNAYICPAGKWTIGYGHTKTAKPNQIITPDRAEFLLEMDLLDSIKAVEKWVAVPLTDNQFSAVVSLVFNIGESQFRRSTLLRRLNAGKYSEAAAEFPRWNKVKGVPVLGLTRRRRAEATLFQQK